MGDESEDDDLECDDDVLDDDVGVVVVGGDDVVGDWYSLAAWGHPSVSPFSLLPLH